MAFTPPNPEPKSCVLCNQRISYIDYKDVTFLRKFMSPHAKILSSRKTGSCTKHQRVIGQGLKRARHMALLPFVPQ